MMTHTKKQQRKIGMWTNDLDHRFSMWAPALALISGGGSPKMGGSSVAVEVPPMR